MGSKDFALMMSLKRKLTKLSDALESNKFVCVPGEEGDVYIPLRDIKKVVVSSNNSLTVHVYENSIGSVTKYDIIKPSDVMVFKTTVLEG